MQKIRISQSLIKLFEAENYCPKKIYHTHITRSHIMPTSDSMLKGSYFETMVIGSGARNSIVTELPRLKNGNKSTDNIRIDKQIENFPIVLEKYGIAPPKPQNCQVNIQVSKHGFDLDLTLDFASKMNNPDYGDFPVAIIDLKLTKDVNNTFGDFCWGTPENLDYLQAQFYTFGFREHFSELKRLPPNYTPPFFYLIFDYKTNIEDKLIKTEYDESIEEELFERIERADNKIKEAQKLDWEARPDYTHCKNCPLALAGDCKLNPKIEF